MSMRTIGLISLTLGLGSVAFGCGGGSDGAGGGGDGKSKGDSCTLDAECASGECDKGKCTGAPPTGSGGTTSTGTGGTSFGTGGSNGSSGSNGISGGSSGPPGFTGSGSAGTPLKPGCGPDTSNQCGGVCGSTGGSSTPSTVVRPPVALCFAGEEDPTPENPIALIEQVIETINGVSMVHLRITFDPSFVDNTYGANAIGWGSTDAADPMDGMKKKKGGHTFGDLVGSDHVELLLTDGSGATVMDFKIDYVSVDAGRHGDHGGRVSLDDLAFTAGHPERAVATRRTRILGDVIDLEVHHRRPAAVREQELDVVAPDEILERVTALSRRHARRRVRFSPSARRVHAVRVVDERRIEGDPEVHHRDAVDGLDDLLDEGGRIFRSRIFLAGEAERHGRTQDDARAAAAG